MNDSHLKDWIPLAHVKQQEPYIVMKVTSVDDLRSAPGAIEECGLKEGNRWACR